MGLTDREKKIIEEMEAALSAEDPRLAASLEKPVRPNILRNVLGLLAGIALILFFISFKLVVGALKVYEVNSVLGLSVPEVSTEQSLVFIVVTLGVTTILSLMRRAAPNK